MGLGLLGDSTIQGDYQFPAPQAGTIGNLQVRTTGVGGVASAYTVKIYNGSTASTVTCAIDAATSSCSDAVHTLSIAQGDLISVQVVVTNSTSLNNANVRFGFTVSH